MKREQELLKMGSTTSPNFFPFRSAWPGGILSGQSDISKPCVAVSPSKLLLNQADLLHRSTGNL